MTEETSVAGSVEPAKKSLLHTPRMILSSLLLVLWCLIMVTVHLFWKLLNLPHREKCYFIFHGGCCYIFSMQITIKGEMSQVSPTLFLSNHISYLDIFVLGKYIPAYFIAKSEVSGWPILGWLAKLQNTLFFERKGKRVRQQMSVMSDHFDANGNLILFPEGTSTEGEHVEPFKSSLLQSVESSTKTVSIQPVTVAYTRYQGEPMSRSTRDQYAWYAKMPFAPHFFHALGLGRSQVEVIFHEPVKLEDFQSRKDCAQHCFEQVSQGLLTANQG